MRLETSLGDSTVLRTVVSGGFKTGDPVLDELLRVAQSKFLSNNPNLRKEAMEKLWDAWERLKTLEIGKDKKDSVRILLDKTARDPAFRETLETEAQELSAIGNSYMIRHTEVGKTPLSSPEQVEYFLPPHVLADAPYHARHRARLNLPNWTRPRMCPLEPLTKPLIPTFAERV